jgi:D-alanyl-D-alanine dipeptidase
MNACGEKKSKNTSIKNTFKNENITTTISDSNLKISNTKNDSISPKSINEIDSLIFRKFDYSQENLSTTERAMADAGLVDVLDILPQIKLDLRYTTSNNFVGEILYPDTKRCFLKIETLIKLSKALKILQKKNSSYTFIIYDGARPQSVQYKMYEIAKQKGKTKYVAKPEKGGLHNFGVAVDIGLYDLVNNQVVDMGTEFDFFGPEAQPRNHAQMLKEGKLTQQQIDNRNLLKSCMKQAGFIAILTEWWHFEAYDKYYTRAHFKIVK